MTKTWNKVSAARKYGYNVRSTKDGWQVAKLTLDGWAWSPYFFPTKERALRHCAISHYSA